MSLRQPFFSALVLAGTVAVSGCGSSNDPRTNRTEMAQVNTSFDLLGSADIASIRYEDPKVEGVIIALTRARKGGSKMGEDDPSEFTVNVTQTGPVRIKEKFAAAKEKVVSENIGAVLSTKSIDIYRIYDEKNHTFQYLGVSTMVVDGSPKHDADLLTPITWDGIKPVFEPGK